MRRRSRLLRRMAAVIAAGSATLVLPGLAAADPGPAPMPAPVLPAPSTMFDNSPLGVQMAAALQSPEAADAVRRVLAEAGIVPAALEIGVTVPQPFLYPAPTVGCGIAGAPLTLTVATAQNGPNFPIPPWIERGDLRFQAIPGFVDVPKQSGLAVAWFNLATLTGGVEQLDDNVAGVPTLSKTVPTGEGTVLAAMFGGVSYASGATCYALPTVGRFTA